MKNSALIGYTGFVGSTLMKQVSIPNLYRSTNIQDVSGRRFDTVVCAAAPAQKWLANREPESDLANIEALISRIDTLECDRFILISTVDVFQDPNQVDERTPVITDRLHAYGKNRYHLENFVKERFDNPLIVRLPGLVGPGLRKNVVFDLLNSNNMDLIESRSIFQFYPMVNLWSDIETALALDLSLVHLTAAPLSVADIADRGFGKAFTNHRTPDPVQYDFRSVHASAFGGGELYQYDARSAMIAIRAYAQSEPACSRIAQ